MFAKLGLLISKYPKTCIFCGFLLSLLSIGGLKMSLEDHIQDGYTPKNAQSYFETKSMREFWDSSGDPMISTIIIQAKNGDNMFNIQYLKKAAEVYDFFMNKFEFMFDNQPVKFLDLCFPYCDINEPFNFFFKSLENEFLDLKTNLSYPVSTIADESLHIERFFFGVKLKTEKSILNKNLTTEQNLTNIYSVKIVMFTFRGDRSTLKKSLQLSEWELSVYNYLQNNFTSELIDVQIIGTEVLNKSMLDDGKEIIPYFAIGFLLTVLFVFITVICKTSYSNNFDASKIWCALITILSPTVAIAITFGILPLLNIHINSFLLLLPYLVLGIGVDDGFLLMHSWFTQNKVLWNSSNNRLSTVLSQIGPSITVTTLTNVISFGIGALSPTSEIQLFCFGAALALTLVYILQFLFLCPIFILTKKYEKKVLQIAAFDSFQNKKLNTFNYVNNLKENTNKQCTIKKFVENEKNKTNLIEYFEINFLENLLNLYCKIVTNRFFVLTIFTLMLFYWYFAFLGTINMKTQLDATKILPKNSQIQKTNLILDKIIWHEYYAVSIFINKEFDLNNKTQIAAFYEMINEFESIPQCRGSISSLIWLREYEKFLNNNDIDLSESNFINETTEVISKSKNKTLLNIAKTCSLQNFFNSLGNNHYEGFIKLSKNNNVNNQTHCRKIERFYVIIAYKNATTWNDRINLTLQWRNIANRYVNDLNTSIWHQNSMFVDQMLSLTTTTLQSGLLTFCCMTVICMFFIPNPFNVIVASFIVASICLGVFGFLSWLKFDLDPIVNAGLLMSIGLSVDYTAHVSYHFQQEKRNEYSNNVLHLIPITNIYEKLRHTFTNVGWPMLQAGLSTVLCVLPFAMLDKYAAKVFFTVICLITFLGVFHGIVVLPCLLSFLPKFCTSKNFYKNYFFTTTRKSYSIRK